MTSYAVKVRRLQVGVGASIVAVIVGFTVGGSAEQSPTKTSTARPDDGASTAAPAVTTTVVARPSASTTMAQGQVIRGAITPKSVVASGEGHVFAQNMMYTHTVTVYDAEGNLKKTIGDAVDFSRAGLPGSHGLTQGAPVEAAISADRRFAYISNYSMYGPGFDKPGDDVCEPGQFDDSYVYRVDIASLAIDNVYPVGSVPKFVAVTPDNRYILVTNWCSYDLSIIDARTGTSVKRVPLGPYPRGIVVDPGSTTAYIAVMGGDDIAKVNLADFSTTWMREVGDGPRHLVIDPAGASMYVTLNGDDQIAKIDLATDEVVLRRATGSAPRSMTISPDGQALYVVNYESDTMTKVRASDMTVLQDLPTDENPIGITYEPVSHSVWVACYSGSITIFNDG